MQILTRQTFRVFFIDWVLQNYQEEKPIFLGGGFANKHGSCFSISEGVTQEVPELFSLQEEADDRVMLHINYAVTKGSKKVVAATSDTDIFVCLVHHFSKWNTRGLKELWLLKGSGSKRKAIPLHSLHSSLPTTLIEVLPALHSLTGCDSTSKVGTKPAAIKREHFFDKIVDFGKDKFDYDMFLKAETFLVHCVSEKADCSTFDDLRCQEYLKYGRKVNFGRLPCTSSSIYLHIERSYLQ